MSWVDGLRHRIRTVLHPHEFRRGLDEEIRFHLELGTMHEGDPDRARRHFGNRTWYAEEVRRMTWLAPLDVIRQDAGWAWRSLTRAPALTLLVVITLALGVGANAAVFTLLDALYLRPPSGVADPASLRRIWIHHHAATDRPSFSSPGMHYPMYLAIRAASGDPGSMAIFTSVERRRLGRSPGAPEARVVFASASYFPLLGVKPASGRFWLPEEDRPGAGAPVAVISHDFWTRRLGADPAAVGSTIALGADPYTIIGVAEPAFTGLDVERTDLWIPIASMPDPGWSVGPWWESHRSFVLLAVWRRGAMSDAGLEERATAAVARLNRTLPDAPDTLTVLTGSIIEARGPGRPRQERTIATRLAGVAAIVLLIATANVANLLLARSVGRRREIAVRLALGISRWRLARLLASESLLLAAVAAAVALLIAWWGGTLLRSLLMPDVEWAAPVLGGRAALFTAGVALLAGLVAGIVPAMQATNPALTAALKEGARDGGSSRSRLRSGLVVAQTALSLVLLVGAALFVRSLHNVQSADIGYDSSRLIFGEVRFAAGEAPPDPVVAAEMEEIARRLEGRPGIESVARAGMAPMRGFSFTPFYTATDSSHSFGANLPSFSAVTPGFFRAAGIRLLAGRDLDAAAGQPAREVVVNEAMARLLWPERSALGECVRFGERSSPCYTVVGVVETVRRGEIVEPAPAPQFYLPLGNMPGGEWSGRTLVVRSSPDGGRAAASALRAELARAFPAALPSVTPMRADLEKQYRPWRVGASLFTAMGALALAVTLVGIYSTVSYGVSQRTHELGVRIALGARMHHVLRHIVGEGVRPVAVGAAVGTALALAAGRLLNSLLYEIEPDDPGVIALSAAAIVGVAALAALGPAVRASRVDPVTALRND